MSKGFLAVIVVVILAFVGFFALSGNKSSDTGSSKSDTSKSKGKPTEHIMGKGQSGVTLVEYGDYQCPYCAQYYPVVKQVVEKYGDQIFFQFRNFPLMSMHQNAFAAARAAEAASMQGKFWQMHDLLYQNQTQWSNAASPTSHFQQYAKQLGLDMSKYNKDFSSSAVNDAINADIAEGNKLKVEATPTFFINGKKIKVTADPSSFEQQIQDAIKQKQAQ